MTLTSLWLRWTLGSDEEELLEEMLEKRVREIEAATGLQVSVYEDLESEGEYLAVMMTPDKKPVSIVNITCDMMGDLDRLIGSFLHNGHTRACRISSPN